MPSITLPSASVNYLDQGRGPVLVLLHGNPGDSRDYISVIPSLTKHYRVIALDWPGYGLSSIPSRPENKTVLFFYEVLKEFFHALNLKEVTLVGNSIGGNAAARLAAKHPCLIKGLILVSPGGFTPHSFITRSFCRLQSSAFSIPAHWLARLYLKQLNAYTQAILLRAKTDHSDPWVKRLNRAMWRSFHSQEHDLRDLAQHIRCPTLLLFGRFDPIIPAKRDGLTARECISHGEFHVLNCGHMAFAERPQLFLKLSNEFLKSCHENNKQSA